MTNHLFRIAGLVCFLPSFAWSQASPRALEVAMTAGLYIAPEASDSQPRGTIAFRFLWGGKGRTHAFGIEAGYFGLGSSEFDAILPIYRVGTSAPPDTARVIERSSATMISILPTYSFRPGSLSGNGRSAPSGYEITPEAAGPPPSALECSMLPGMVHGQHRPGGSPGAAASSFASHRGALTPDILGTHGTHAQTPPTCR